MRGTSTKSSVHAQPTTNIRPNPTHAICSSLKIHIYLCAPQYLPMDKFTRQIRGFAFVRFMQAKDGCASGWLVVVDLVAHSIDDRHTAELHRAMAELHRDTD